MADALSHEEKADWAATNGFFLAVDLFSKHPIPDDPDEVVVLLKALVFEQEKLVNSPADYVVQVERRAGRRLTDSELAAVKKDAEFKMLQIFLQHRELARQVLRGLQAQGIDVGIRPHSQDSQAPET